MSPEEILAELSAVTVTVPAAALRAAVEHQEALTEPLLDALRRFVENTRNPAATCDEQHDALADMAMYLLPKFREVRAFPLFAELCSLPEERGDYWLGDLLPQDFPSFLASTCGGDPAGAQRLAASDDLPLYARWTALDALLVLVACGAWPRQAMIDWLGALWPRWQANGPDADYTPLVNTACTLAASELLPLVREAYARGQVDPHYDRLESIEDRCARAFSPDEDIPAGRRMVEDPATQMEWQRRFHPSPEDMDDDAFDDEDFLVEEPYVRPFPKVGRNDPCPCGSGKKYKKCCMNADGSGPEDLAVLS